MHRIAAFLLGSIQRLVAFTRWVVVFGVYACAFQAYGQEGIDLFESRIRPVLAEQCYECHSSAKEIQGGLNLDSRAGIQAGGDSGAVIEVKDPEGSLLLEALRYANRDLQMPPSGKLPEAVIADFAKWIELGAPDPRTGPAQISATGMSVDEGRQFWSFKPVEKPAIPSPTDERGFVQTPIDAFVLANLKMHGLAPASLADRQVLIRRATQDLIGLPPTPAEVEAFLLDESPDAFSKVVDRLLDSPNYGIRWGRHWLDVARYADSNGLDENIGFGNAWRYRDYVVDAFNADKPFDAFLVEQIAGDLIAEPTRDSITATCFLQLGPKVLAEPDIEKLHMDVIDEQIDTLGKAFMGMTLGCVRCHDHKFDPIKQTDYYALAAIFKGTQTFGDKRNGAIKFWYEHSLASDEDKKRLEEVDKQLKELNSAASSFKNSQIAKLRADARGKVVEYLIASTKFDLGASLDEIQVIADSLGLHARVLHHCRQHLEFHRDDEFFQPWHNLAEARKLDQLESHYRRLFRDSQDALAEAKKSDPKSKTLKDPILEQARLVLADNAGLLAVPAVESLAFDAETLAEYHRLLDRAREFESAAPDEPALMSVAAGEPLTTMAIRIRGDHKKLGEEVEKAFPVVMCSANMPTEFPDSASGRLELAQWMASPNHPLTARVMVNRIWAWHFGRGLVSTTENFGVMGDRPANAELLDWLACYFVESGWSVKAMHRLVLGSSTWQMSSQHPRYSYCMTVDPENRWRWKQSMRRLEAEQLRDSILAASGRLDGSFGGKTLPLRNRQFVFNHTSEDHTTYESLRRAIYLPVIRNNLYTLFEQFDYPDPTMPTGTRSETVVAPQALLLMNDPLVLESAQALAKMTSELAPSQRVRVIYRRCLGREPESDEVHRDVAFVKRITATGRGGDAWELLCQSILVSNEFMYIR